MSDRQSYDERRMALTVCACGRSVSHPTACHDAGTCLMARRDAQIAAIQQRQQERRDGRQSVESR